MSEYIAAFSVPFSCVAHSKDGTPIPPPQVTAQFQPDASLTFCRNGDTLPVTRDELRGIFRHGVNQSLST
jgi:hypothetical protein